MSCSKQTTQIFLKLSVFQMCNSRYHLVVWCSQLMHFTQPSPSHFHICNEMPSKIDKYLLNQTVSEEPLLKEYEERGKLGF